MRRELIAKQGFYTTAIGFCEQSETPTPSIPTSISTINGDLTVDNDNNVVGDSQFYLKDGAGKIQNLPLLLEGDELEVNFRTMKAKITHKFKAVRIRTASGVSSTYTGSFYISNSNSQMPNRKFGGRIFCTHAIQADENSYAFGQCFISSSNGSANFWFKNSSWASPGVSSVNSWLSSRDVIVVYELDDPEVEYIDLDEKLRNHPLMEYGNGVEYRTLNFEQGYIDNTGSLISCSNHITSEFITSNFKVVCKSGYKVSEAHLFDMNNNLVSYKFFDVSTSEASDYNNGLKYEYEIPKGYKMKITVVNSSSSSLTPDSDCVDSFIYINTRYFQRESITNVNYKNAHKRAKQLCNVMWKPVITKNYNRTGYSNLNKDQVRIGVPYSEVGDQNKFIGKQVSFKTFLSAINNPISLFYTETPYDYSTRTRTTEYGINYISTEDDTTLYYGIVCACLADYTFDINVNYTAKYYLYKNWLNGEVITPNSDCSNLRPLDLMASPSHVIIIIDILKDLEGNIKFIETAESRTTCCRCHYYTPEEYLQKVSGYSVFRYSNLSISEPENTPFIPEYPEDSFTEFQTNPTICTFAGDYATFTQNSPIHISVKSYGWDGIKIYKESTLLATVDFTNTERCTTHTVNNEDWIDVDVSSYFTRNTSGYNNGEYGVYTCVAYNSNTESDPTHFEVLLARATFAKCNNVISCMFKGDDPYALINGGLNGYPTYTSSSTTASDYKLANVFTEEEKNIPNFGTPLSNYWMGTGNCAFDTNSAYIRVMFKGLYGYGTDRIQTSSISSRSSKITWSEGKYFDNTGAILDGENGAYTNSHVAVNPSYTYQLVYKDTTTDNYYFRLIEYNSSKVQLNVINLTSSFPVNDGLYKTIRYKPSSSDVYYIKMSTSKNFTYKVMYAL